MSQEVDTHIEVVALALLGHIDDPHLEGLRISLAGLHRTRVRLLSYRTILGVDDVAPAVQAVFHQAESCHPLLVRPIACTRSSTSLVSAEDRMLTK
jgi:hypothetical protein